MKHCLRPLICPVCDDSLIQANSTLRCSRAHSFDIAREGYANLLLSRKKLPQVLGDTPEMLRARRRFLNRGYYTPLSDSVNSLIHDHMAYYTKNNSSLVVIMDAGCGEGFYTGRLDESLQPQQKDQDVCVFGVDIAKTAVRMAAKRYKGARFLVADLKRKIPFADSSVQILLNIFAPRNRVEFARVLTQDGLLLVVIPHPEHLLTLRRHFKLLEIEEEKHQQIANQLNEFQLVATQRITTKMELNNEALIDLVHMTPNAWHLSAQQWQEIGATMHFQTQASFEILLFRPTI